MKEYGPEYYDSHMKLVQKKLEDSPWRELYQRAAEMLPSPSSGKRIADLGSGTGRFAKHLWNLGYREYIGVDFAGARVAESRRYVPELTFVQADLFDGALASIVWKADVFVALEVLEHIERDLELLLRIPQGALVILSVPNYPSESHVRRFDSCRQIEARYGELIKTDKWATVMVTRSRRIFVCRGVRR